MTHSVDHERRRQIEFSFNHLPPLVRMPDSVKEPIKDVPEAKDLEIFLLPLHQTDGATGKAMPAYELLKKAEREGRVYPGCTVAIPSSGNTALSVGWDQPAFGIARTIAIMNADTPEGKKAQLRFPGVEIMHPRPGQTTLQCAEELERDTGAVYLRQYEDRASIEGHRSTMRHVIMEMQDQGKELSFISIVMGTCSLLCAAEEYLRNEFPNLHVIGNANEEGPHTPGARTLSAIRRDIKFPWEPVVGSYGPVLCDNVTAFGRSLWLMRRIGRPVGPTTGLSIEGLLRRFRYLSERKELEQFAVNGKYVAIIVSMDAAPSYGVEYEAVLGKNLGGAKWA